MDSKKLPPGTYPIQIIGVDMASGDDECIIHIEVVGPSIDRNTTFWKIHDYGQHQGPIINLDPTEYSHADNEPKGETSLAAENASLSTQRLPGPRSDDEGKP